MLRTRKNSQLLKVTWPIWGCYFQPRIDFLIDVNQFPITYYMILDRTVSYFWSGAYLYGPRVPNIIGKPRILEIELFGDPGSLEILDIQELGVLGSWKYWISTNMVYWVPGNIGYQPTWCTGFLGGTAATAAASQQLSNLARPLAQGGQEKISRKGNPSLRYVGIIVVTSC